MRHQQFRWLFGLSYLVHFVCIAAMVAQLYVLSESCSYLGTTVAVMIGNLFLRMVVTMTLHVYTAYKGGASFVAPTSPEGMPVSPSGIWLEPDEPLEIGSCVLACSQGVWHRAVVIDFRSRGRVLVHYPGWDPFWDEVHSRARLQAHPHDSADPLSDAIRVVDSSRRTLKR